MMNKSEKVQYLKENHSKLFNKTYREASDELSKDHELICVCSSRSRKNVFPDKVLSLVIERLKYLIPK